MDAWPAASSTVRSASDCISSNNLLIGSASNSFSKVNRLRTTSYAIGASRKPMAEPTPASAGITTREIPSFRAKDRACSGAPPPNPIRVRAEESLPLSTA